MPTLEDVKQGIKVIHSPDNPPLYDIVAVPGLGADPVRCWASQARNSTFNWIADRDGLQKEFPDARIMLYQYESAWKGPLKVNQSIGNAAWGLLLSLMGHREGAAHRPVVFIGHSMGGVVVAKAVCLTESRHDRFPQLYESVAGCFFLGTPFRGAAAACTAVMLAEILQKWDKTVPSSALNFLTPENQALQELREEFIRVADKLRSKVQLFCVFEEHPTDFAKEAHLELASGFLKKVLPKNLREPLVSQSSAVLDGHESMGMACAHRHLNRFDNRKDGRYVMLRDPLRNMVHGACRVVKGRLRATRQGGVDDTTFWSIMDVLQGSHVFITRNSMTNGKQVVSWVVHDEQYRAWADCGSGASDYLWISGNAGKGKSKAALAAIDSIEKEEKATNQSGRLSVLVAYFLCDSTPQNDNAESLLRSLLWQMIHKRRLLAQYARQFTTEKTGDGLSEKPVQAGSQAKLTVENLWRSLQDMLTDDTIENAYFVVSNLHELSEASASTQKFFDLLASEFHKSVGRESKRIKWLLTSKGRNDIEQRLGTIPRIDLNDAWYDGQREQDLEAEVRRKVADLGKRKNYDRALTYFAGVAIETKAENALWVDVTCMQLEMLPSDHIKVRTKLDDTPAGLKDLLNLAWGSILGPAKKGVETLKEILRVLLLTYEDPTEAELIMLAHVSHVGTDPQKTLHAQIQRCRPLITTQNDRVKFLNKEVKQHLKDHAKRWLGVDPKKDLKSQHGILALRCFAHVVDTYSQIEEPDGSEIDGASDETDSEFDSSELGDEESYAGDYDWAEEEENSNNALRYADRYWLSHAKDATSSIADLLSREADFWEANSRVRFRWLKRYNQLTGDFDDFTLEGLRALHVASSIGYPALVSELLKYYAEDICEHDELDNQPLHYAAAFGQVEIMEELLRHGADVNDGAEKSTCTPLHMAAEFGHIKAMEKLIQWSAATDAIDEEEGPALNCAVLSGNIEAVKTLLELGDPTMMSFQAEGIQSRLAVAARLADIDMVNYLIDEHGLEFQADDYDQALFMAAFSGNEAVLYRILEQQMVRDPAAFQAALDEAVEESQWSAVRIILQHCHGLSCGTAFCQAAAEGQTDMLNELWAYAGTAISYETIDTALYHATDAEQEEAVLLLLDTFYADSNATGDEYGNALTASANDGTERIIQALLDKNADPNSPNGWALHIAASQGHTRVVELLLDRGADPDYFQPRYESGTAMQAACESGRADIVEMLLQRGANPNRGQGSLTRPIIAAAHEGEAAILELLVRAGAEVNVRGGPDHGTVLNHAAATLPADSLRLLLDEGQADLHAVGAAGNTALIVAAMADDDESVALLLDRGAALAHDSPSTGTALHAAAAQAAIACMALLLQRGADVLALALAGPHRTVLDAAVHSSSPKCVALVLDALRARHAPLPAPVDDASVLHAAATAPDERCLTQLLDHDGGDALLNAVAGARGTPLAAAALAACNRNVRVLLDRGADPRVAGAGKHDSALQAAALKCDRATVALLLGRTPGADLLVAGTRKGGPRGKYGSPLAAAAVRRDGTAVLELLLERVKAPRAARMALERAAEYGNKEAFVVVRDSEAGKKIRAGVVEQLWGVLMEKVAAVEEEEDDDDDDGGSCINSDFGEDVVYNYQDPEGSPDSDDEVSDDGESESELEDEPESDNEQAGDADQPAPANCCPHCGNALPSTPVLGGSSAEL